uniref:Uncharacterized protein n=1 Tax=Rhizophora mucronata TaxID=61149 RepID=A0A2P2R464_RHIMU
MQLSATVSVLLALPICQATRQILPAIFHTVQSFLPILLQESHI